MGEFMREDRPNANRTYDFKKVYQCYLMWHTLTNRHETEYEKKK